MTLISRCKLAVYTGFIGAFFTFPTALQAQTDPPLGLWISESVPAPSLHGKLVVLRNGAEWVARISRLESRFRMSGDKLFPRLPRGLKYSYAPPFPANDGLKSGRAREVGMDEAQLAKLVQRIANTIPNLPRAPFIHSLLIARKGTLILEEYFAGYDRETPHDTRSATKTFPSVMLGALIQEGNKVRAGVWGQFGGDLLPNAIIPAIR